MYNCLFFFFFFNDTATTEIYTLSLHDALPIYRPPANTPPRRVRKAKPAVSRVRRSARPASRSEEHTSELQSQSNLVCRLLLEKKKKKKNQKETYVTKENQLQSTQARLAV